MLDTEMEDRAIILQPIDRSTCGLSFIELSYLQRMMRDGRLTPFRVVVHHSPRATSTEMPAIVYSFFIFSLLRHARRTGHGG